MAVCVAWTSESQSSHGQGPQEASGQAPVGQVGGPLVERPRNFQITVTWMVSIHVVPGDSVCPRVASGNARQAPWFLRGEDGVCTAEVIMVWATGAKGPWSPSPQVRMAFSGLHFLLLSVGFSGHQWLVLGTHGPGNLGRLARRNRGQGSRSSEPLDFLMLFRNWHNSGISKEALSP